MTTAAAAAPPPAGIHVPVPTFFVPKKTTTYDVVTAPLDLPTQAAHAVYLAKAGIRGLVLLGSTGEAVHLHTRERFQVIFAVRQALEKEGFRDYPLIAGTATQNVEETVEHLRGARDAGAQWGLVLVPGYFSGGNSQDGIVAWCTAVADRSPIPVMIYHYPAVSNNVRVTAATIATLAQHPNVVGCKLSHGDLSTHAQIASHPIVDHAKFHTYTGLGQQLLPVVSVGGAGAIDGQAGYFPRSAVRLYELASIPQPSDEEIAERRALQYKYSALEELVVQFGTVGIKEAIARLRGFGEGDGTRAPLAKGFPGGDAEWERWQSEIAALEEVESSLGKVEEKVET